MRAIRRRPQKIGGSWLIYSDSLLFHHHRKIISPGGIPNIQKGFLEQISRVEGSLFFLLLACGWHWIFLSSYWGKMTLCVHIKRGRCIPSALLQAKRECVPFSNFFSGITTKSWKSELPLCDPFLPFASGVWERGPVS